MSPAGTAGPGTVAELPFFDLEAEVIDEEAARILGSTPAGAFEAVVLAADRTEALVAFARPSRRAVRVVGAMLGREVRPVVADPEAIAAAQRRIYGPGGPTGPRQPPVVDRDGEEGRLRTESLARRTGLPVVSLDPAPAGGDRIADPVDPQVAALIGFDLCRALGALPLEADAGTITVASADPEDRLAARVIRTLTGREPRWLIAPEAALERAIDRAFPARDTEPAAAAKGATAEPAPAPPPEETPAQARPEPARYRHLGELLRDHGLVTEKEVQRGLEIQRRTGDRLGQILMHVSGLNEETIVSAISEQGRLTEVDLDTIRPEEHAVEILPEGVIRRYQVVPLEVDGETLVVAMADSEDADALAAIREHTELSLRIMLAPAVAIDRLLHRVYGEGYVHSAVHELVETAPEESAHYVLSRGQRVAIVAVLLLLTVGGVVSPVQTIVAVSVFAVAFYLAFGLYRMWLVYRSFEHDLELPVSDEDVANLDERTLPVYTILVPLHREAAVLPHLLDSIRRLDYPPTKLDVKLLLEEDDAETRAAVERVDLPPQFSPIVVPHAHPQTKPKACNYGLPHARGEMVVVYDAEDEPESDQLKKVVASLRNARDPRIVCVQARLNYYNPNQNLLTRWFTTEYSMWFDLFLPGLDATDVPIPLGGTSNHFLRSKLDQLGGWDPFNVTEDADLGIRLYRHGYRVAVVDSTTYEEANSDVRNWVRQRSRWVKGYIQTWLVHMRHPLALIRAIGLRRWLSFQLVVGGTFLVFLLNPIFWGLTSLWTLTEAGILRQIFPGIVYYAGGFALYVGNFLFAYVTAAGASYRGYNHLVKYALVIPFYWSLMSVAAWKGLIQLIRKPFYWEKTEHGLFVREERWEDRPRREH